MQTQLISQKISLKIQLKLMKKYILLFLTILFVVPSCKYDDGPFISIYTKTERIVGNKSFKKVLVDGEDITTDYKDQYVEFFKNGSFVWYIYDNNILKETYPGTWTLSDNKKRLAMLVYFESETYSWDWEIKRLTYADTYLESTNKDGKIVRWELYKSY